MAWPWFVVTTVLHFFTLLYIIFWLSDISNQQRSLTSPTANSTSTSNSSSTLPTTSPTNPSTNLPTNSPTNSPTQSPTPALLSVNSCANVICQLFENSRQCASVSASSHNCCRIQLDMPPGQGCVGQYPMCFGVNEPTICPESHHRYITIMTWLSLYNTTQPYNLQFEFSGIPTSMDLFVRNVKRNVGFSPLIQPINGQVFDYYGADSISAYFRLAPNDHYYHQRHGRLHAIYIFIDNLDDENSDICIDSNTMSLMSHSRFRALYNIPRNIEMFLFKIGSPGALIFTDARYDCLAEATKTFNNLDKDFTDFRGNVITENPTRITPIRFKIEMIK